MTRPPIKPLAAGVAGPARTKAGVDVVVSGETALVTVVGLVDERFSGFGQLGAATAVVINVAGMTRMTSFGVRQWLKAMSSLPKSVADIYLLACPTFFVDQLNMVLNFGGAGKVLTVIAPYTCPACGVESGELVDVLAERSNLSRGTLPDKECSRCGGKLEFDETVESYFAFLPKYAASAVRPAVAKTLSELGLYKASDLSTEKPPRIIKLVHGSVTYFRIVGTIGAMFRARPLLVGAEGEVVIDVGGVEVFDPSGHKEWRRLLKSLAGQVPSVSLVDVDDNFLTAAGDTLTLARNIAVATVMVPYVCSECGRHSRDSAALEKVVWPLVFPPHVCTTCGGATHSELPPDALGALRKAGTSTPLASARLIATRDEVLSRAVIDASVAQAGEAATPNVTADDMILGKYKIVRRLSAGGMADVFLATQVGIGGFEKPVALKRIQRKLLESRQQAIELFLNEAKIAGRLIHPNIVQVLDVGEVQGALYLAMEYVHGKDLRNVAKKLQQTNSVMPLAEACYVIREVAQALDHAYWATDMAGQQLAVVHRDVSPHNVILGHDGTVKLLDFGVAMSAVTEHAEKLIVGKWMYMSPEATTHQAIDHRSDLFSLGVIAYLLCSGSMPFNAAEPRDIVTKIRAGAFRPLAEVLPVPGPLSDLVGRLLAAKPEDRPQRGQDVAAELTEIMRQFGLETSGGNITRFLAQLFPEEGGSGDSRNSMRVSRVTEDSGSYGPRDKSPMSITPSSLSVRPSQMDISQTFRRSSEDSMSGAARISRTISAVTSVPIPGGPGSAIGPGSGRTSGAYPATAAQVPAVAAAPVPPVPVPSAMQLTKEPARPETEYDVEVRRPTSRGLLVMVLVLVLVALVAVGYLVTR